jgi:hypothetical protein
MIDPIRSGRWHLMPIMLLVGLPLAAHGQDITAVPIAKMAPELCPGQCVQVLVRNLTDQSLALRLRNPGGNWQTFTFQPGTGLNFRCHVCAGPLEARLPEDDEPTLIMPPTAYDILYDAARRRPFLVAKRP